MQSNGEIAKAARFIQFPQKSRTACQYYKKKLELTAPLFPNEEVVIGKEEFEKYWKKYAEELFRNDDADVLVIDYSNRRLDDPTILGSEAEKALKSMKNNKVTREDKIQKEVIKQVKVNVLTKMYDAGEILHD